MGLGSFNVTVTAKEGSLTKSGKAGKGYVPWDLDSDLDGKATLADLFRFTKGALIQISEDVLKEEQDKGFDDQPTLIVDGKFGRRPEDVNPLGKIQYVSRANIKEMIMDIFEAIRARTKIVTGEYSRHNVVTFNGQEVARTKKELETWVDNVQLIADKDVIRFINTAPYARKLERLAITNQVGRRRVKQKHKKADSRNHSAFNNRVAVPNGTYALAYKDMSRKYKNNSFMRFRMLSGAEINIVGNDNSEKTGKPFRRSYKKDGRPYLYPSILVSVVSAGTKRVLQ